MKRGLMIVVSGPAGSGKGTVNGKLLESDEYVYSVSATTRAPRPGEINGINSHFITKEELDRFTDALNIYLKNLTSDGITMPIIVKLESLMGSVGAMVHPTIKVIYEAMSELDTADIKLEGVTKLLNYPEYSDVSKAKELLGVLEEKEKLLDVISAQEAPEDDIHVYIGGDESGGVMSDTSMIFKTITINGKKLSVGVIGPKRMNYSKVIDMINQLTTGLDRMFGDERLLGDGEGEI